MIGLKLTKSDSSNIEAIPFRQGQVIYCIDSFDCYFDNNVRFSGIKNYIVAGTLESFNKEKYRYMNRVYIDLETEIFYKFNFNTVAFEVIRTDDEFMKIINRNVSVEPATLADIEEAKKLAPITLASNVYSADDGTTTLDQMIRPRLYVTSTTTKYAVATYDNQKVFEIPFPFAKYDLYNDHMNVIITNKNEDGTTYLHELTANEYKVMCGNLVINDDLDGVPLNQKIIFIFYYTKTVNLNKTQIVTSDDIRTGAITIDKLDPDIEIPIYRILQEENMQTVNQDEKNTIAKMKNFKIEEIDANIVTENNDRMFVTKNQKDYIQSLIDAGENGIVEYVHPETHPASMILLRNLNLDVEEYSRVLEDRWENTEQKLTDVVPKNASIHSYLTPGKYSIHINNEITGFPVDDQNAILEVVSSTGKTYEAITGEWIYQKLTVNTSDDKQKIYYSSCSNKNKKWSDWTEVLTTSSESQLQTEAKDIIGAINEVFQLANDGKAKWLSVIGYPLDEFDTFANLYEKTLQIKQNIVDKLIDNGLDVSIDNTLQELVDQIGAVTDKLKTKTGNIVSSTETAIFSNGKSNFESYYVSVDNLFINTDVVNIYYNDKLYATFKKGSNGMYKIGTENVLFIESSEGAWIGDGFKIPVAMPSTIFNYYAVPVMS